MAYYCCKDITPIKVSISKLLSDYSISVVDVEIEKIYKIPSTRFLERNKVSRKVPKNIISATMYMKIKAI